MKRLFIFSLLLLSSAAYAATKNKISMVTYFPVPYVAYSQVNTTEQMDIGLTSTCDMKLGCSETSATLNATRVNLKGGKLNLDGGLGIKGYSLNLGSGYGDGKISFQNVRIQTGNMESINAEDIKAANLNLFGKAFPSCKNANSESGGQMQWTSLKLKGASSSELYLACGALKDTPCCSSDELSKGKVCNASTHTCECPAGKTENSSGYCAEACTPSKDSDYYEVSAEEAEEKMAHKSPCNSSWRGNPYKYSCRAGESRICPDAYQVGTETKLVSGSGSLIPNTSTPCSHGIIFPTDYNGEKLLGWERIGEYDSPNCSYYAQYYNVGLMGVYTCKDSGFGRYEWKIRGYCRKTYKYKYIDRKVCCP